MPPDPPGAPTLLATLVPLDPPAPCPPGPPGPLAPLAPLAPGVQGLRSEVVGGPGECGGRCTQVQGCLAFSYSHRTKVPQHFTHILASDT